MNLNSLGLIAAASAFFGIWLGHVSVRAIERRAERLWIPIAAALGLGAALEIASLTAQSHGWSAASGILGMAVLWSALEFRRQEKRIRRGHAPANPATPRHARILAQFPAATPRDPFADLTEEER